jgi:hypothetical protein
MASAAMTPVEFQDHLDSLSHLFARATPFAILIDCRGASPPSARERQTIGARMRRWHQDHPGQLVGLGVVLSSAIERGVFTAISWAAGKGSPARAFATPQDAEAWLLAELARRSPGAAGR